MAKTEKLGQQLMEAGLVSADQLQKAVEYQQSMGGSVADAMVKLGFISDSKLTRLLAQKHNLPVCDLSSQILPEGLMARVPFALMIKHQVVPVQLTNKTLTIAIADPMDYDAVEELQYATSLQVEFNLAERGQIAKAIGEFAQKTGRSMSEPSMRAMRMRPASQGALKALSEIGENALMDEMKTRSEGKITGTTISKADIREAAVAALLKKGVITKAELFDATLDLLMRKGVLTARDIQQFRR